MPITILHTGQTGVERGAARAAQVVGLPIAGFCNHFRRDEIGALPSELAEHLIACLQQGVDSALLETLERANVLVACVPTASTANANPGIGVIRTRARALAIPEYIVDPSTDLEQLALHLRQLEQVSNTTTRILVTGPRGTRWEAGERLGWLVVSHLSLTSVLPPVPRVHKILVVEDDEILCDLTCALLREDGHEATAAATGGRGLELAEQLQPDIAIVDLALPDITGYDVAHRIRTMRRSAVFLTAITGWAQGMDPSKAVAAGFDRHVIKPASHQTIRAILKQANLRLLLGSSTRAANVL